MQYQTVSSHEKMAFGKMMSKDSLNKTQGVAGMTASLKEHWMLEWHLTPRPLIQTLRASLCLLEWS